jgi:hypothetical protein
MKNMENTQADYRQAYEGFYSKYYDELEQFAKDFFIAKKSENRNYIYVRNKLEVYLYNDYVKDIHFLKNDNLMGLYYIYQNRASYYDNEFMLDVFKVEIKNDFNKIDIKQFPKNYNYLKFIEEVAFVETRTVIFGLISAHAELFEMIYKFNRFDIFEIRYYQGKNIKEYPNYRELDFELNPQFAENVSLKTKEYVASEYQDKIWFTTGVKLATGEAFRLYEKYKTDKGHFTKICLELGFKETDRPYFSATIQNNDTDKNSFANKGKLQKLHKHLTENNLNFGAEFLAEYNKLELE